MSKIRLIKIIGIVVFCFALTAIYQNAQAQTDAEALQPASAVKVGDLGRYFDEYSSYMQLSTALHSSETMHLPDVHIGEQGIGGVTFFNGTIINETVDPITGADRAVTFGDKVRIDDYVYRNAPGAADEMPVLIGDGLVPALDDINALGESGRRWQYLYVSDNVYGEDVIHEDNLSITNTPTDNYFLGSAGNNRFTWLSVSDHDTLSGLSCTDGQIIVYDSATTSWICSDPLVGDHDGTSRGLRIETGITSTIGTCAQAGYTNANRVHDDFATAFTSDATYTVTATYYTGGAPTASAQTDVYPIDIVKDADNGGFFAYTCFPDESAVMWQAIGY